MLWSRDNISGEGKTCKARPGMRDAAGRQGLEGIRKG